MATLHPTGRSKKSAKLIGDHAERIPIQVFYNSHIDGHLKDELKRKHGVYALLRDRMLYYVGMSKSLYDRVNRHRLDRHKGKWTHFSVFVLRRGDYSRDLERILLRLNKSIGNRNRGSFSRDRCIRRKLRGCCRDEFKKAKLLLNAFSALL